MENMNERLKEINDNLAKFKELTPEQMKIFHEFLEVVEKDSILSRKQKELISVAIAVVSHCEWCIAFHVKAALDLGCTEKEIIEAAWVAVLMGGAPALMYAQLVLKAIKDFAKNRGR